MVELPWLVKKNRIIRQNFISVLQVMKDKTDLKMGEVDWGGGGKKKKKERKKRDDLGLTSSRMCSTCSSRNSFLSLRVLFFFSRD